MMLCCCCCCCCFCVLLLRTQVSDANPTMITPASFAFSIWALIYALMALFCLIATVPWLRAGDGLLVSQVFHGLNLRRNLAVGEKVIFLILSLLSLD